MRLHQKAAPTETLWQSHVLGSFYDPSTRMTVSPGTQSMLDAASWGVQYDRLEVLTGGLSIMQPPSRSVAFSDTVLLRRGTTNARVSAANVDGHIKLLSAKTVEVDPTPELERLIDLAARSPASASISAALPEVLLVIDGVERPRTPTVAIRVFVNCANPSLATPIDDPSYVGTLAFFADHHQTERGSSFILDVRDTLTRLRATGAYSSSAKLDVALLPYDTANPKRAAEQIKPRSVRFLGLE